jgi:hypothetical protein
MHTSMGINTPSLIIGGSYLKRLRRILSDKPLIPTHWHRNKAELEPILTYVDEVLVSLKKESEIQVMTCTSSLRCLLISSILAFALFRLNNVSPKKRSMFDSDVLKIGDR